MKTASWWLSLVASGMTVLLCFAETVVAQHYSHWGILTKWRYQSVSSFAWIWASCSLVALCASTLWYKNFISGLCSCENQPPWSWLTVEILPVFGWRNISGLFGNPFFVAYIIPLGCQSYFMAKLSALVILCELCSWMNILGGHEGH
jgi:hypothetical protein